MHPDEFIIKIKDGQRWSNWQFDAHAMTLHHVGHDQWRIDLHRCVDGAHILDWIAAAQGKGWCSDEDMGSLVRALDELFNLHTACGGGQNHAIDPAESIRLRLVP
jgi:hypothetical protein